MFTSDQGAYFCAQLYEREDEIRLYEKAFTEMDTLIHGHNSQAAQARIIRRIEQLMAAARSATNTRQKFGP